MSVTESPVSPQPAASAQKDKLIARASQQLRVMSHHTGGTLRLDAYRVIDTMQELINAVDEGRVP